MLLSYDNFFIYTTHTIFVLVLAFSYCTLLYVLHHDCRLHCKFHHFVGKSAGEQSDNAFDQLLHSALGIVVRSFSCSAAPSAAETLYQVEFIFNLSYLVSCYIRRTHQVSNNKDNAAVASTANIICYSLPNNDTVLRKNQTS